MTAENETKVKANTSSTNILRILLGLALLVPALFCYVGWAVLPTIRTALASLQHNTGFGEAEFIGLENYSRMFGDEAFGQALGFTFLLMLVRLLVVAIVPPLLAFFVNEFGRAVRLPVRLLFTLPLAMFAPVVTALVWNMALNPHYGLFMRGSLADPEQARGAFLLADGLTTFGLACGVGLIFYLAALRGRGEEVPSWRQALRPMGVSWLIGGLAVAALTLQSLVPSYVMTMGGPGGSTTLLGLYQHRLTFLAMRFGSGAAVATLTLLVVMLLGLLAGLLVAFGGLRLELGPRRKRSGLLTGGGENGWRKPLAIALLALLLLGSLGCCTLGYLPRPWNVLNSLKSPADMMSGATLPSPPTLEAYEELGDLIPTGQVRLNSMLPPLILLLLQLPVVYLGALGIGGLRPLKRWSELLLLPFSPWLFVTVLPFSIVALLSRVDMGVTNSLPGLIPPMLLSVPSLFILTLFFKGQESHWRAAQEEGAPAFQAFFRHMILPSLPLVLLLACATFLIARQDLAWPLVSGIGPEAMTATTALLRLHGMMGVTVVPAAIVAFELPLFLVFFVALGLFQAFYLDRLVLSGSSKDPKGTKDPEETAIEK